MTEAFLQATTLFHHHECGDISGPLDKATRSCTTSSNSSNVNLVVIPSSFPCLRCWNLADEGCTQISEILSHKGSQSGRGLVNYSLRAASVSHGLLTRDISLYWPKLRPASLPEGTTSRRLQSQQTLPPCPPKSQLQDPLIIIQEQLMQRTGNQPRLTVQLFNIIRNKPYTDTACRLAHMHEVGVSTQ
jgi:hypothetical protein